MPSPFNNDDASVERATGAHVVEIEVTDSTLTCMSCFAESSNGWYAEEAKRLRWDCVSCGEENVVRGIEI